jgi:putative mRNA 3-end processing factor
MIEGKARKVKAEVKRFDFSGHSGRRELFEMVKGMRGNPKVWTVHGEHDTCIRFAEEINSSIGLEAYAPLAGESIQV